MIEIIVQEAGKPVGEATVEVDRGIFTIETAAEEAKRIQGDVIPLDLLPSSKGRFGIVRRFPIGPIAGISPFNFPLNLALHKVAPAIASGNTIVLKPPTLAPLTMLYIAKLADEIGLPKGVLNVLPMDRTVGDTLVADDRFKLLSFTGSPDVGWDMKRRAGLKPVVLELGGNAGVLVDDDADLDFAVSTDQDRRLRLCRPGLHLRAARVHPRGRVRDGPRSHRGGQLARSGLAIRPTRPPNLVP